MLESSRDMAIGRTWADEDLKGSVDGERRAEGWDRKSELPWFTEPGRSVSQIRQQGEMADRVWYRSIWDRIWCRWTVVLECFREWLPLKFAGRPTNQASLGAQRVKGLPAVRETQVRSLGWEDPLEKQMATHSSTLAWKIPWTEKPGGLQSMGSQRVGHD